MKEASTAAAAQARYKREAAEYAVQYVESGMTVGLGTGTTAIYATRCIAERYISGQLRDIVAFATSRAVWHAAVKMGIPMLTEDMPQGIDLTIDDR